MSKNAQRNFYFCPYCGGRNDCDQETARLTGSNKVILHCSGCGMYWVTTLPLHSEAQRTNYVCPYCGGAGDYERDQEPVRLTNDKVIMRCSKCGGHWTTTMRREEKQMNRQKIAFNKYNPVDLLSQLNRVMAMKKESLREKGVEDPELDSIIDQLDSLYKRLWEVYKRKPVISSRHLSQVYPIPFRSVMDYPSSLYAQMPKILDEYKKKGKKGESILQFFKRRLKEKRRRRRKDRRKKVKQ